MLRLENIVIGSKIAEADFFPENEKLSGHICVNLSTEEIEHIDHVPGYEFMYPGHARQRLVRMAKEHDTRSSCVVMWF